MRYKRPDRKNAASIIKAAKINIDYTLKLKITPDATITITRNVYESFRMLGDALLVEKGISAEDHITQIKELTKLSIDSKRPIQLVENLRKMRHNVNYYGYLPSVAETEDAVSLAKACFYRAYHKIKNSLK